MPLVTNSIDDVEIGDGRGSELITRSSGVLVDEVVT